MLKFFVFTKISINSLFVQSKSAINQYVAQNEFAYIKVNEKLALVWEWIESNYAIQLTFQKLHSVAASGAFILQLLTGFVCLLGIFPLRAFFGKTLCQFINCSSSCSSCCSGTQPQFLLLFYNLIWLSRAANHPKPTGIDCFSGRGPPTKA